DNGYQIKIELYPDDAPNTVNNFIDLAESGFYEYTFISQVIPGFYVKMGDPRGDGFGYPGYYIESECKFNNHNNRVSLTRGTLAMARSESFNTEGSQFFIVTQDSTHLNGQYSAFARVIEGIEVIDNFGTLELDSDYIPNNEVFITNIEIELNGYIPAETIIFAND
ncbi:MAG: hypothetical protein BEN19_02480, partial [Epulopiscium sp. Nuni2H_MBin003]